MLPVRCCLESASAHCRAICFSSGWWFLFWWLYFISTDWKSCLTFLNGFNWVGLRSEPGRIEVGKPFLGLIRAILRWDDMGDVSVGREWRNDNFSGFVIGLPARLVFIFSEISCKFSSIFYLRLRMLKCFSRLRGWQTWFSMRIRGSVFWRMDGSNFKK